MQNKLVVYFSHSGNTAKGAKLIGQLSGADILEINADKSYPKGLWETVDIFKEEIKTDARPKLSSYEVDISKYDVVFVGTPNWGDTIATPLRTFFDENDFSAVTVVPFVTHGSGGVGNCAKDIPREIDHTHYKDEDIDKLWIKSQELTKVSVSEYL